MLGARLCGDNLNRIDNETIAFTLSLPTRHRLVVASNGGVALQHDGSGVGGQQRQIAGLEGIRLGGGDEIEEDLALLGPEIGGREEPGRGPVTEGKPREAADWRGIGGSR